MNKKNRTKIYLIILSFNNYDLDNDALVKCYKTSMFWNEILHPELYKTNPYKFAMFVDDIAQRLYKGKILTLQDL